MDAMLNSDFDLETLDFSIVKNNGFDVESIDFCDVGNQVGVKSVEEMNAKNEIYKPSKKFEYIELDESLVEKQDNQNLKENNSKKNKESNLGATKTIRDNKEKKKSTLKPVKPNLNPIIDTIEFNALKGSYIISYHELGNSKTEEYFIGKKELYENELKRKEKIAKWGKKSRKLNRVDMNLYTALSRFDAKHSSNCAKEYLNGNTDYITNYYMSKVFKNKEYNFKEKLSLIRTANRQRKYRKAETENPKGLYAVPVLASFALVLGLVGINLQNNNKNSSVNTNQNPKKIVSDADSSDSVDSMLDDLVNNTEVIDLSPTTEVHVIENIEKEKQIKEEIADEVVETTEKENYIYDSLVLDNMDLEYSPIENITHVNTSNLDYVDNYKISRVSVYDGNTILFNEKIESIDNKTITDLVSDLNSEYGEGIKIYVNWNAFDKNGNQVLSNVGWSNIENLKVKDISYNNQIQKLNEAKKTLLSLTNGDSSKGSQTGYVKKQVRRY